MRSVQSLSLSVAHSFSRSLGRSVGQLLTRSVAHSVLSLCRSLVRRNAYQTEKQRRIKKEIDRVQAEADEKKRKIEEMYAEGPPKVQGGGKKRRGAAGKSKDVRDWIPNSESAMGDDSD